MKKTGVIILIWILVTLVGSMMIYLFLVLLIFGLFAPFIPDGTEFKGFIILFLLSLKYSLPSLAVYSFYSLKRTTTITELIEESPGRLIAIISLTFAILAIYHQSFFTFFGILPFIFATIIVFGLLKIIIKD